MMFCFYYLSSLWFVFVFLFLLQFALPWERRSFQERSSVHLIHTDSYNRNSEHLSVLHCLERQVDKRVHNPLSHSRKLHSHVESRLDKMRRGTIRRCRK